MALVVVLFVLVLVLLCAYVARVHYVTNILCEKIPTLPGGYPVVGHSTTINSDLHKFVMYSAEQTSAMGGITRTWFGTKPMFIVTEPELGKKVLNTYFSKPYTFRFAEYWVGKGIFTAKAERWKRTRKLLNPAFNQKVLDGFVGVFNEQARSLADAFAQHDGKGTFDFRDMVARNLLETVCLTMMGMSSDKRSVVSNKYMHSVDRLFDILNVRLKKIWLHLDFMYNSTDLMREEHDLVDFVRLQTDKVLALRKADASKKDKIESTNKFKTFLELILEMDDHFTEKEIADEVNTMIVAGYDTSASTMMTFFIMIGSYPQVQEKIYQELKEVFGDSTRDVEKEDFNKLSYLDATVKEFIRLFPIAPIIMRDIDEPYTFDKGTIPSGSVVLTNAYGLNVWEEVWGPDAKEFIPERWLDPNTSYDYTSLLSFGYGRRSCIGKIFILMTLKIYATHVLRRLRVTGDLSKIEVHLVTIIKFLAGCEIAVDRR